MRRVYKEQLTANTSDQCNSRHSLKKKKKYDPLLNHDIHTCRSVRLFIYRGATWIRRGAGNERRHQRKGEDDDGMNNGAIKQEKDMQEGGKSLKEKERNYEGSVSSIYQQETNPSRIYWIPIEQDIDALVGFLFHVSANQLITSYVVPFYSSGSNLS